MAISKKSNKAAEEAKQTYQIEVTRAKELDNCIMFDMTVNGVQIYGCSYRTLSRKDGSGDFAKIGFPSRKGKDDKYYNECYFKITDELVDVIEKGIEALI